MGELIPDETWLFCLINGAVLRCMMNGPLPVFVYYGKSTMQREVLSKNKTGDCFLAEERH